LGDRVALDGLLAALRDEFVVQCKAIWALGELRDPAALPALLAMLKDVTPEIRYHAAGALAEIGHENAVVPLQALVHDPDPLARRGVDKALEKLRASHPEFFTKTGRRRAGAARSGLARLVPHQLAFFVPHTSRQSSLKAITACAGLLLVAGLVVLAINVTASEPAKPRGRVQSLVFSPDGGTLAAGRTLGLIEFWNTADGNQTGTQASEYNYIRDVAYGPDAATLMVTDGQALSLWQAGGKQKSNLQGHIGSITAIAATPDRSVLATYSIDGMLFLWDPHTGQQRGAVRLNAKGSLAFAVSPKSELVAAVGKQGDVGLLSVSDGTLVHKFTASDRVTALAFSPDGKQLAAASQNGAIVLWDLDSKQPAATLTGERKLLYSRIQFTPDGAQLVAVASSILELWDLKTGKPQSLPPTDAEQYDTVAVSPDSKLLAAGGQENGDIWLFSLESRELVNVLNVPQ
jgi:tricorn protease-like protein